MNYKSVLKEEEQIHYVTVADIIKFITKNSDIKWNDCCDFVRYEGIVGEEDNAYWIKSDIVAFPLYYSPEAIKWINAFFEAHPWITRMMVVFDD